MTPTGRSGDHVVSLGDIPGPRWDLALGKIAAAGPLTVLDGEPPVALQRYDGWPGADGHIHVSIFTIIEPPAITQEIAERDVRDGLEHLRIVMEAEPRLAQLVDKYGIVREYVFDYGSGAARVGTVSAEGSVTLL